MRSRRRHPAKELRLSIECLPARTKRAMLDGVRSNDIIIGAYVDRQGGVCPMLAAHRNGGRTSFVSFARAWDRYTGARKRARRATEREVLTLTAMLEASLARDEGWDLATVAAEHRELKQRIERDGRRRSGETDRTRELERREGWAWLRPFRRYEDFEAALSWLDEVERETAERELVPN